MMIRCNLKYLTIDTYDKGVLIMKRKFVVKPKSYLKASTLASHVDPTGDLKIFASSAEDFESLKGRAYSIWIDGTDFEIEEFADDYLIPYYHEAIDMLERRYPELYIEPSVQLGCGSEFASFKKAGVTYQTSWDYEYETETLFDLVRDADSQEGYARDIADWIESMLKKATPCEE